MSEMLSLICTAQLPCVTALLHWQCLPIYCSFEFTPCCRSSGPRCPSSQHLCCYVPETTQVSVSQDSFSGPYGVTDKISQCDIVIFTLSHLSDEESVSSLSHTLYRLSALTETVKVVTCLGCPPAVSPPRSRNGLLTNSRSSWTLDSLLSLRRGISELSLRLCIDSLHSRRQ